MVVAYVRVQPRRDTPLPFQGKTMLERAGRTGVSETRDTAEGVLSRRCSRVKCPNSQRGAAPSVRSVVLLQYSMVSIVGIMQQSSGGSSAASITFFVTEHYLVIIVMILNR